MKYANRCLLAELPEASFVSKAMAKVKDIAE
jgi:hypothetical protein